MSAIVRDHPGRGAVVERRRTAFVGMSLALASFAMLFASLFFSYAIVRFHAAAWPPPGSPPLPRALPLAATLVLLASSALLLRGSRGAAFGAAALGALFLALQLAVAVPLWRSGFTPASGVFGSVFFALVGLHALHALAGVAALALSASRPERLRPAAMFWHFVDAMWLATWAAVYLL